MAKSYPRRLLNKAKKVAKKRYLTKKGLPKVSTMVKDIRYLKRALNVEKKYVDMPELSHKVGQLSATSVSAYTYGYKIHDITPEVSQSLLVSGRSGNSVKLVGASIRVQLYHNLDQISKNQAFIDIYKVDQPKTVNDTTAREIFDRNLFYSTPIIDSSCFRNPNYMSVYKKIATRKITIPADSEAADKGIVYLNINLKLNQHLRFNDTTAVPANCQYLMVYRATNGNISGFTYAGSDALPTVGANTGYIANTISRWWYVDN